MKQHTTETADFNDIRGDWNRLWELNRHSVDSHWDWIGAVHEAYGNERQHCHSVVRCNGKVVGILSDTTESRSLISTGIPRADSMDILNEKDNEGDVVKACLLEWTDAGLNLSNACFDLLPDWQFACNEGSHQRSQRTLFL